MEIDKKTVIRTLIVLVDIVVLIWFIVMCFQWFDRKMNTGEVEGHADNTVSQTYRKFTYDVPEDIDFSIVSEYRFMLKSDSYEALVMPFVADTDEDDTPIETYVNDFETYLHNYGINVSPLITIEVNDHTVYTYNKSMDRNSVLCYYHTFSPFYYEIELFNNNEEYDTDALEEIINILETAYYDSENSEKFEYWTSYEVFHYIDKYD